VIRMDQTHFHFHCYIRLWIPPWVVYREEQLHGAVDHSERDDVYQLTDCLKLGEEHSHQPHIVTLIGNRDRVSGICVVQGLECFLVAHLLVVTKYAFVLLLFFI